MERHRPRAKRSGKRNARDNNKPTLSRMAAPPPHMTYINCCFLWSAGFSPPEYITRWIISVWAVIEWLGNSGTAFSVTHNGIKKAHISKCAPFSSFSIATASKNKNYQIRPAGQVSHMATQTIPPVPLHNSGHNLAQRSYRQPQG